MFVSRDRYTHELEYMRADKWKCPDTICNVQVSPEQKAVFDRTKLVLQLNHTGSKVIEKKKEV